MLGLTVGHQQLIKSLASMWAVDMTVTTVTSDVTQFRTYRAFLHSFDGIFFDSQLIHRCKHVYLKAICAIINSTL